MPSASRRFLACLVFSSILWGCFTETGNPGDEGFSLTAKFDVDYAPLPGLQKPSAAAAMHVSAITRLATTAWKADFETDQGSVNLWDGLPPRWVDFPAGDTLLWLPDSLLFQGAWRIFHFNLGIPEAHPVVADTLAYSAFQDTSYMKGSVECGAATYPFLFEMPKVRRLALIYHDTTLAKFRTSHGLELTISFQAQNLFKGMALDSIPVSHDREGKAFLLLNQKSPGGIWPHLKDNFWRAFEADSIEVEKTPLDLH